jgi:PAS domain S-box-containing protein
MCRVTRAVAESATISGTLQACTNALVEELDAALARIWQYEPEQRVLELKASSGMYTHLDGAHGRIPLGQAKIGRIALRREAHLTNDVVNDPEVTHREWAREQGIVGFAGFPLLRQGELLGVLAVFSRQPLPDYLLRILEAVAVMAANAIEHERLERARQESLAREKAAREEAEILYRAGKVLTGELDLERVVQAVTDSAREITGAQFGALFYNLLDSELGEAFQLYTLSGAPQEAFSEFPHPRATALFGPTFRGEAPIRLDDVKADPRYGQYAPYRGMPPGHLPVTSYLAVPVLSQAGEVLGGLFLGHSEKAVFTAVHERLVQALAHQAATTIETARLYERLRVSEQRLSAFFNSTAVGVAVLTPERRIVQTNRAFQSMVGYSDEELQSSLFSSLLHEDDAPAVEQRLETLLLGRWSSSPAEHRWQRPSGALIWVESNFSLTRDGTGKPQHLVVLCHDVTERKQVQDALRRTQKRLESALQAGLTGTWMFDIAAQRLYADENVSQYFVPFYDLTGRGASLRSFLAAVHPEDRERVEAEIRDAVEGQHDYHTEYRILKPDGSTEWISARGRVECDHSGRPVSLLGVVSSIQQRKQIEEALRVSEGFRQIADSMPQIVWTARPEGAIDYYNERWYEFTGFSREDIQDDPWEALLHSSDVARWKEKWSQSVHTGEPYHQEFRLWDRKARRWRWHLGRALPVRDRSGAIVKWFGTCTDIDEQKHTEERLSRAIQDLEQFAFSASHDLQEPLRNVALYSQLLKRRYAVEWDRQANEFLDTIVDGSQHMMRLVSDLLAYTRAAQHDDLPVAPVAMDEILKQVLKALHSLIVESRAELTYDALPMVPLKEVHLQQLLQNLIGNALKYRRADVAPRVHVSAARLNGQWRISVRDNGIGIDPEHHERVFGIFKRLDPRGQSDSGTGIGLAICQKIVERYDGAIWVDSQSGRGATFHFTVPAAD